MQHGSRTKCSMHRNRHLPGTMNDTNYTITGCSLTGVTNPLFVAWMGSKTTTSFQVIIGNTADSAAIATGTLECGVIHD